MERLNRQEQKMEICKKIIKQPMRRFYQKKNFLIKMFFSPLLLLEMHKTCSHVMSYIEKSHPQIVVFQTLDVPLYLRPLMKWIVQKEKLLPKICVILHNTDIMGSPFELKRRTKWYLELSYGLPNRLFNKKLWTKMVRNIDGVITLSEHLWIPPFFRNTPRFTMPSRFYSPREIPKANDEVRFVVPGSVNNSRRDYRLIMCGLSELFEKNPQIKKMVSVTLLGRMEDNSVRKMIDTMGLKENIRTFTNYVPEEQFNRELGNAHFAIIVPPTNSTYGVHKISGPFWEAFCRGVPIIAPSKFQQVKDAEGSALVFFERTPSAFSHCVEGAVKEVMYDWGKYKNRAQMSLKLAEKFSASNAARIFSEYLEEVLDCGSEGTCNMSPR
jgi:hypothetical protein